MDDFLHPPPTPPPVPEPMVDNHLSTTLAGGADTVSMTAASIPTTVVAPAVHTSSSLADSGGSNDVLEGRQRRQQSDVAIVFYGSQFAKNLRFVAQPPPRLVCLALHRDIHGCVLGSCV